MRAVVTGGGGFVMANFLRRWLEADAANFAVVVDLVPLDKAAARFLAPVRDRIAIVAGDVAGERVWQELPRDAAYVVHGAAMTPHPFVDDAGVRWEPERERPLSVIEANILGTARALDWARGLPRLRRFVFVSSGSVYAEEVPAQRLAPFPLPEDGYLGPRGLYDISKHSSELILRRFAELYRFSAVSVRLSNVFGPMDRPTSTRNVRNPANVIAYAAAFGRRITAADPDVPGDYVYAPDVATALGLLLQAPATALRHDVYNLACGATATIRELFEIAREASPDLTLEAADPETADIKLAARQDTGRWGAYDISRAAADFGWRPRPLREAMHEYIAWLRSRDVR